MLLDWNRNSDDACLGFLTRILWKSGNQETVYLLKEVWKLEKLKRSNSTT